MPPAARKEAVQQALNVEVVKQYPGQQQVDRAVKVMIPGRHFPGLEAAEQRVDYEGTAVEYVQRHTFGRHLKAWGAAQTGPGIRFVCTADAIDDPDNIGHWTTLGLWCKWRRQPGGLVARR